MIRYSVGIIALLLILTLGTVSVLLTNGHTRLSDGKVFEKTPKTTITSTSSQATSSIASANTVSTQTMSQGAKPAKLSLEAVYNKCDDTGSCKKLVAGKFTLKPVGGGASQVLTTNTVSPTEVSVPAGVYILSVDDVSVEGVRVVLAPATVSLKSGATTKVSISLSTK